LQLVDRRSQLFLLILPVGDRLGLGFQFPESLFGGTDPGLKFLSLHEPVLVGVNQASDPASHAADQPHETVGRTTGFLTSSARTDRVLSTYSLRIGQE
jgi:hypothetical protein